MKNLLLLSLAFALVACDQVTPEPAPRKVVSQAGDKVLVTDAQTGHVKLVPYSKVPPDVTVIDAATGERIDRNVSPEEAKAASQLPDFFASRDTYR